MSYLRYLCCLRILVSHTYCVVFLLVFVLDLVCPMLPVSLDCPFLIIAPSLFCYAYLYELFLLWYPI